MNGSTCFYKNYRLSTEVMMQAEGRFALRFRKCDQVRVAVGICGERYENEDIKAL